MGDVKTKEFIQGVRVLTTKIIARAKDGVDVNDAVALFGDADVRAAIAKVIDGAKGLPAEAKELTLDDFVDLTPEVTGLIVDIIKAVKAPAAD